MDDQLISSFLRQLDDEHQALIIAVAKLKKSLGIK